MRKILIIDGTNMFLRNYSVVPEMNENGDHVGGLVGTIRSLRLHMEENSPTDVFFIWDGKGGSARRRGIFSEYKAGRKPRVNRTDDFGEEVADAEANMRWQFATVEKYLDLLGITQLKIDAVEADDVIAYIAYHMFEGDEKVIVSTDKDFFQLITDKISVYSPKQKVMYTPTVLHQKFGVLPSNFIYMKMLCGDGSDGIPGIDGIGVKTVVKLFPFLGEEESTMSAVLGFARENREKKPKYKQIDEQRDRMVQNVTLMQLTVPSMAQHSIAAIRSAVEGIAKEPMMSELRLLLIRDGIQVRDSDLFGEFKKYHMKRKREIPTNEK